MLIKYGNLLNLIESMTLELEATQKTELLEKSSVLAEQRGQSEDFFEG
jgi:hypothetical protein